MAVLTKCFRPRTTVTENQDNSCRYWMKWVVKSFKFQWANDLLQDFRKIALVREALESKSCESAETVIEYKDWKMKLNEIECMPEQDWINWIRENVKRNKKKLDQGMRIRIGEKEYEIIGLIGKGAYAQVYKVKELMGKEMSNLMQ